MSTNKVSVLLHPFTSERVESSYEGETTVSELIEKLKPEFQARTHLKSTLFPILVYSVGYDDVIIKREEWATRKISGKDINMQLAPAGSAGADGQKNPLQAVLQMIMLIATAAASIATAGALTPALGAVGAGVFGGLTAAGVSVSGVALNNLLFPAQKEKPRAPEEATSKLALLEGGRNQIIPYAAVPQIFGKARVTPMYICSPSSRVEQLDGKDRQYYLFRYILAVVGFPNQRLRFSDVKIGDTSIDSYNVTPPIMYNQFDAHALNGYYTEKTVNVPLTYNMDMPLQYTTNETTKIKVTIYFPYGLYRLDPDRVKCETVVKLNVSYRKTGTEEWTALDGDIKNVPHSTDSLSSRYYDPKIEPFIIAYIDSRNDSWVKISEDNKNYPPLPDGAIELFKARGAKIVEEKGYGKKMSGLGYYYKLIPYPYVELDSGRYEFPYKVITDNRSQPKLVPFTIDGLPLAKYDIKVERMTLDDTSGDVADASILLSYAMFSEGSLLGHRQAIEMLDLEVLADERLTGVADAVSLVLESVSPMYDRNKKEWSFGHTSNPSSLILIALTGEQNAKHLKIELNAPEWAGIDKSSFERFYIWCEDNKYEYNNYVTKPLTVRDQVNEIATAGRSFVSKRKGKWEIIIDRLQDVPRGLITNKNSWGASTHKSFPEVPDALRISFINELNDYKPDEMMVYNDGNNVDNSRLIQAHNVTGITHPDRVWRYGRELLKAVMLRTETHTVHMDWEYMIFDVRDRVIYDQDYLMTSLGSGRVKEVTPNGFIADNDFVMPDYPVVVVIRRGGKDILVCEVDSVDKDIFYFSGIPPTGINHGDLFIFGRRNSVGLDCLIANIEPMDQLTAKLTLIAYAPNIYEDPNSPVPPHSPNININPFKRPQPPRALHTKIGYKDTSLGREYTLNLFWTASVSKEVTGYSVWARQRDNEEYVYQGDTAQLEWVFRDDAMSFTGLRVAAFTEKKLISDFVTITDIDLSHGEPLLPADVNRMISTVYIGGKFNIVWQKVLDKRPVEYEIRKGTDWDSSPIVDTVTARQLELSSNGTYLIKAKVPHELYSLNPAKIEIENIQSLVGNVIYDKDEAPEWRGLFDPRSDFFAIEDVFSEPDIFKKVMYKEESYLVVENVNDAVYERRAVDSIKLTEPSMVHIAVNLDAVAVENNDFFSIPDVFAEEDIFRVVKNAFTIQTQIKVSKNGVDGEWQDFVEGDYFGDSFNFKMLIKINNKHTAIFIKQFRIIADVPDRVETHNNIAIKEEGTEIFFDKPFNEPPSWQGSILDASGNEDIVINKNEITTKSLKAKVIGSDKKPKAKNINLVLQGY